MDARSSYPTEKSRNFLSHFAWLAGISILYWAFFYIPLPRQFRRQGIFLTDELIFLVVLGLVFLTFRYSGRGARYIRLLLIFIMFTLPLYRLWETAESSWNIVLGLLPWADATEYYFDASRILQGGLFSAFSGRRPLFASLFAAILQLSQHNLQITLLIFTIINGLAVFLFVEEIHYDFGSVSAIIALFLSQLFYRPFVGTALTEQLGYPVGMLALVLFLRAVRTHKVWLFSLGLLFLTYALMIRAGTFFVLPVLIVFAMVHFSENRQQYFKVFLMMMAAVLIPVLTNTSLGRTVASPEAVQFSNFADTLYGQARGGVRWTQAVVDHPELASMREPRRSQLLYRLAFEEIKNNPLGLARGSLKAWKDFLLPGWSSAFAYLSFGNQRIDFLLQAAAALIFLAGLVLLWKDRGKPVIIFILVFWVGIFLSIPLLPPVDAGIRPYAATVALMFLPICSVFSPTVIPGLEKFRGEERTIPVSISSGMGILLIGIALLGAPLLRTMIKPVSAQPVDCETNLTAVNIKVHSGSYILLSSPNNVQETKVPVVRLTDVQRSFDEFAYGDFAGIMRKLKQPTLIAVATDVLTGKGMWIVAPAEWKAYENQTVSACAEMVFATYPVMFIKTAAEP